MIFVLFMWFVVRCISITFHSGISLPKRVWYFLNWHRNPLPIISIRFFLQQIITKKRHDKRKKEINLNKLLVMVKRKKNLIINMKFGGALFIFGSITKNNKFIFLFLNFKEQCTQCLYKML